MSEDKPEVVPTQQTALDKAIEQDVRPEVREELKQQNRRTGLALASIISKVVKRTKLEK